MKERIEFENFDFENLDEIEEIVTPGTGVTLCCS